MFEDQLQAVQELLGSNEKFRQLYEQHQSIREDIEANNQIRDHFALERLKKQKLQIKDQLAVMLNQHTNP